MLSSPFRRRLVNGSRPVPGSFRDRLSYLGGASDWRLPRYLLRGASLPKAVKLRAVWARSHARRRRRDRHRVTGFGGWGDTLPVRSPRRHRYDAWGGG
jgi:hypothetical protein